MTQISAGTGTVPSSKAWYRIGPEIYKLLARKSQGSNVGKVRGPDSEAQLGSKVHQKGHYLEKAQFKAPC